MISVSQASVPGTVHWKLFELIIQADQQSQTNPHTQNIQEFRGIDVHVVLQIENKQKLLPRRNHVFPVPFKRTPNLYMVHFSLNE